MNGRLLGIDHGNKRIGLAISDPSGLLARELTVIHRRSKQEDFAEINRIAAEHAVIAIVVGIPINDMAAPGEHTQADTVRLWVARFAETHTLPIVLWDESLTSEDARQLSIRQGRHRRAPIDDLAARLILQSYLDAVRDGLAEPPPQSQNQ
jgi:putative Holliday junction resolvase